MWTVRFFVVVVAVSSVCKFANLACVAEQHGRHARGTGTQQTIPYRREVLLRFCSFSDPLTHNFYDLTCVMNADNMDSIIERKKHKKGKLRRVRRRPQCNTRCCPLPSIIVTNVRSIRLKSDNLEQVQSYMTEYRDVCVSCLSETWFCGKISKDGVSIDGFGVPFRTDRDAVVGGKKLRGGVCLYLNESW